MKRRGFAIPILLIVIGMIAAAGGALLVHQNQKAEQKIQEAVLQAEELPGQKRTESSSLTRIGERKPDPEKCPDGVWDAAEQADPSLCPEDMPSVMKTEMRTRPQGPAPPSSEEMTYRRHDLDVVYQFNSAPRPSWVPESGTAGPGGKLALHPYHGSIYMETSEDGMTFGGRKLFLHHAGVPHITMTKDNKLVATFQYFSPTDFTIFDVIAYTTSDDFGKTWSPVNRFYVKGVCPAERNKCNDPILLQTEGGRYRLYFSHSGPQEPGFWMYSAINDELDTPFTNEGPQVDASDVSDPAVVYFKNKWHYLANRGDAAIPGKFVGVHAVSDTGQEFVRMDNSIILDLPFLGDVIEDNGKLRFFAGHNSAYSYDGDNWIMEPGRRIERGADPGVVKLPDGSYIMLYVDSGPTNQ